MMRVMRRTMALALGSLALVPSLALGSDIRPCGTRRDGSSAVLALHRYFEAARVRADPVLRQASVAPPDRDLDQVALLVDRGDLVVRRNAFDLDLASLRFRPNQAGGYDVARLGGDREARGDPLSVATGGAALVELPFPFPFFGRVETRAFVHADGTLTFGQAGLGDDEPGLADFLAGPPRLAAFFARLDPTRAGAVTARLLPDRAVFDWREVPGAGQINRNSFQAILYPTGEIDLAFGEMQTREGVVGLSPGEARAATAADLSSAEPHGSRGALAEQFSETEKVDLVSVTRRFYRDHPDLFEQLVVYTTRPLNPFPDTLAFQLNVKNEITGIGLAVSDDAADYGSAGGLRSLVYMDAIDPYLEVDGFEILGHEVGHRWLARLSFLRDGAPSGGLLGRGAVHWSFFADTDASVLEGNDIEDQGAGDSKPSTSRGAIVPSTSTPWASARPPRCRPSSSWSRPTISDRTAATRPLRVRSRASRSPAEGAMCGSKT